MLKYNEAMKNLPDFEKFSDKYNGLVLKLKTKTVKKYYNGNNEQEVLIKLGEAIWEELYKLYGVKPRFERW